MAKHREIWYVEVLDHCSSDKRDKCRASFIGEYVGKEGNYIYLIHCDADRNDYDAAHEYHCIVESAIVHKQVFIMEEIK